MQCITLRSDSTWSFWTPGTPICVRWPMFLEKYVCRTVTGFVFLFLKNYVNIVFMDEMLKLFFIYCFQIGRIYVWNCLIWIKPTIFTIGFLANNRREKSLRCLRTRCRRARLRWIHARAMYEYVCSHMLWTSLWTCARFSCPKLRLKIKWISFLSINDAMSCST